MAKESTAIANLLEIAARRPIDRDSGDDLLFAPRAVAEPPKAKPWRARSVRELKASPKVDDTHQLTHRIARYGHDLRKPLLAGALVLGGLALGLSVYKLSRHGGANVAAAAAVAQAPPVKPIVVEPLVAPPPPPRPALVNLVLESKPAGATVKVGAQIAGTTPLALSVDPGKDLDITFALDGQAKTLHVDPHTMKHVTVELAVVEPDPEPAPAAAPAPAPVHAARAAAPAKRAAGGSGTLMISTKPPCDIAIDGASTGLTAPQRSIKVAAGHHQLTLTNKAEHVKKTVAVEITANHATRVIKDFM